MRCLLPFQTTYLCESSFSTLAFLKNKYRARLEPENAMRLSLSIISPRIDRLCGLHHAQILLRQVSPLSTHTHARTHAHTHVRTHAHTQAQAHQWAADYFLVRMVVPGTK